MGKRCISGCVLCDRFYFIHSFIFKVNDQNNLLSTTKYSIEFASSIFKKNVIGTQFHPEKSQKAGLKIINNFCKNNAQI